MTEAQSKSAKEDVAEAAQALLLNMLGLWDRKDVAGFPAGPRGFDRRQTLERCDSDLALIVKGLGCRRRQMTVPAFRAAVLQKCRVLLHSPILSTEALSKWLILNKFSHLAR